MVKTISTCYSTDKSLIEFIKENDYLLKEEVLGQIFFGGKNNKLLEAIIKIITEELPKIKIAGISCETVIYNGKSLEGEILISFTNFEKTNIEVKMASILNSGNEYYAGEKLAKSIVKPNTKVLLLFAASPLINSQSLLEGIDSVKENLIIVGGSAFTFESDLYTNTLVCANDKIGDSNSFVLVALSGDELIANCEYMFNWLSVGQNHKITKVENSRIVEIEGKPARLFYEELIGEKLEVNEATGIIYTLVSENDGVKYSHPVYAIKDSTDLGVYEQLSLGTNVRLSYGNRYNILEEAKKQMEEVALMPAESIMFYSCEGRYALLKEAIDFDVSNIRDVISVNGFYAAGEFSNNANGKNICVKNSASLLVLAENPNSRIKMSLKESNFMESFNKEDYILYRFLHKSVDDLEKLNDDLEKKVEAKTAEIKYRAHYNSLTDLYNNFSLIEHTNAGKITKLAFIEFKFIRDFERFYGIAFSKKLQRKIAEVLKIKFVSSDFYFYQIRTDIFAIGSNQKQSEEFFLTLIKSIQKFFTKNTFNVDNVNLHFYNKIGIAMETIPLRDRAFLALQVTNDGSQSVVVYSDELCNYEKTKENLLLINEIQEAIDEERIVVYYQPILNNKTGEIFSYECLMRMLKKDGTLLMPITFLETAQKSGLYSDLTKIMVNTVFNKFKNSEKSFSINLDVLDMFNEETMEFIYQKIRNFPEPHRIIVEILESADIETEKYSFEILKKLKNYGVCIAIDDFGSGYSNIKYLVMFNVDFLKIDGTIVKNIAKNKQDRRVVKAIKDMASASSVRVVAEYVENVEVQKIILKTGIEFSQGYYIGKPLPKLLGE